MIVNYVNGGEIGIRTLVALSHPTDFESGPFNRSGISPLRGLQLSSNLGRMSNLNLRFC